MSDSDYNEIEVEGRSSATRPEQALREALSALGASLAARGGAPFHLVSMQWLAPNPAVFDPKIHALDLCYREVFGGFRPSIGVAKSAGAALIVSARARIPRGVRTDAVWHGHALAELAREYSPRGQVASMDAVFAKWTQDGDAFRAGRVGLDMAYGPSPFEKLDLFFPASSAVAPQLWVFIHGGYWQASDKDQHAQFAAGMLKAGYAVAMLNYGLCPDVPLERIVGQVRTALAFLASKSSEYGFAPDSIHIAGHSAGGHLAAMAATETALPIRSALLLSGLYDLEPLALLPVGRLIGITSPSDVERLSPIKFKPRPGVKISIGVGGLESSEFKWQSEELARVWNVAPPFVIAGANHFSLLDGLMGGELLEHAQAVAR
jgi:arylformamidase